MRPKRKGQLQNVAFFVAILATAVALGGALAHAFEFFQKMAMTQEEYLVTQSIYAGWNRLAYVLMFELLGMIALIVLYRRVPRVALWVIAGLGFYLASQAVFWIWTFPANVATNNWTEQPANWEELRREWEYSHFAGAVFQLMALSAILVAVLKRDPPPSDDLRQAT